ncbi:LOW QUALITY PROTEIN: hypothetical protein Syun_015653 [Stephania yunnanensis]|uniref:Tyrosinase copper-binding domain-containing protein n=1 Tax=Stephania yunnanensis TaxID=152371 RepID=A0AAP0JNA5_9MAGN
MDPKRWVIAALLGFIVVGLSVNLFTRDHGVQSHDQYYFSFLREFKETVLNTIDGSWMFSTNETKPNEAKEQESKTPEQHHVPLSPNLTACHRSLSDADRPVYCCPPKPASEETVVEFQFPDPSAPLRIRRAAHKLDKEFISKYQRAIAIMRGLPSDDPRNFMRQANIHCIYCTGAYNQMHSNSLLKIHRSRMFFPFHRMMIYFHERILGNLIGDDTFALPYWNWDNPDGGMFIPDFYLNGSFVDTQREKTHLPPQVADIDFDYVERGLGTEDQIEYNVNFMYHQMISGAKKTELFMGCPIRSGEDGFCDGPGTIELAPHNALHTWVGNTVNPERENMGAFYSAARDPIFYAHHSNIDRLWEVWRELNDNKLDINDPEWLDSHFVFHDEKSQLSQDQGCLGHFQTGYAYERSDNVWMNARPKPAVPPKIARQILKLKEQQEHQNNLLLPTNRQDRQDFGPEGRTLDDTLRLKVQRPKINRTSKEKEEEEEVLVIYDIDVKKDSYVKFDVYVNAVDETIIGPESREFAGTFVNMRKGVRLIMNPGDAVPKKKSTYLKLGISELLQDLEAEGDESIWVTIVPRGGTGVNTTVGGVRIEYIR